MAGVDPRAKLRNRPFVEFCLCNVLTCSLDIQGWAVFWPARAVRASSGAVVNQNASSAAIMMKVDIVEDPLAFVALRQGASN